MEDRPLVSIITIVYNGEKYIAETIRSVISQTYNNIEYVIVDGGSTDNTLAIIKQFGNSISSLISEKDKGISDAFNKGLALAKGSIIGIVNADDWYEKDAVEKVVAGIGDYDIAYGDLQFWKDGKPGYIQKGDHRHLENEMSVNHPTAFVKKECYEQAGLFDMKYKCAMDYDLMLRFKTRGFRFVHIPSVLTNMRWEGFSDTRWLMGCQETLLIKDNYLPDRKWRNRLYFYKHVLAIAIPRFLEKIRLGSLVRLYRSHFSVMKKRYE